MRKKLGEEGQTFLKGYGSLFFILGFKNEVKKKDINFNLKNSEKKEKRKRTKIK